MGVRAPWDDSPSLASLFLCVLEQRAQVRVWKQEGGLHHGLPSLHCLQLRACQVRPSPERSGWSPPPGCLIACSGTVTLITCTQTALVSLALMVGVSSPFLFHHFSHKCYVLEEMVLRTLIKIVTIKCLVSSGPSVKHSPFLMFSGSMSRDCSHSVLQMKRFSLVEQIGTRWAICRALPLN